jgi:hypothetical protein
MTEDSSGEFLALTILLTAFDAVAGLWRSAKRQIQAYPAKDVRRVPLSGTHGA